MCYSLEQCILYISNRVKICLIFYHCWTLSYSYIPFLSFQTKILFNTLAMHLFIWYTITIYKHREDQSSSHTYHSRFDDQPINCASNGMIFVLVCPFVCLFLYFPQPLDLALTICSHYICSSISDILLGNLYICHMGSKRILVWAEWEMNIWLILLLWWCQMHL